MMIFIVKFIDKDNSVLVSEEIYSTRRATEKAMKRPREDFIKVFTEVYYKEKEEEQFECIGYLMGSDDL